jgi:acetyl-CoA carboxylase carboxyl transferase subunit beta
MALFGTWKKKIKKREIPSGVWARCDRCQQMVYKQEIEDNLRTCPKCNYHFSLTAKERLDLLLDAGSFEEREAFLTSVDPLGFKGPKTYVDKLKEDQQKTGMVEGVLTGTGQIEKHEVSIAVTDSRFIMGSMGSVVGEKITRTIEYGIQHKLPVIIVSGSGGGARMYEGCLSLMQMAKTSGALGRLNEVGVPFLSVLTDPTMAGIMASFASLGDVILAEPGALMGFAGPRVIKQTIHQELPKGFQRSEFLREHGFLDLIVQRQNLKSQIASILNFLDRKTNLYQRR